MIQPKILGNDENLLRPRAHGEGKCHLMEEAVCLGLTLVSRKTPLKQGEAESQGIKMKDGFGEDKIG